MSGDGPGTAQAKVCQGDPSQMSQVGLYLKFVTTFVHFLLSYNTYDTPISFTVSLIKRKLSNIAEVTLHNTQTSAVTR